MKAGARKWEGGLLLGAMEDGAQTEQDVPDFGVHDRVVELGEVRVVGKGWVEMPFGDRGDAMSDADVGLRSELGLTCYEEGDPETYESCERVVLRAEEGLTSSPFSR